MRGCLSMVCSTASTSPIVRPISPRFRTQRAGAKRAASNFVCGGMRHAVASAVRAVQPEASARGITVHLNASAVASVLVWADVRRVGQVLRNLLANALAYTPAGGRITVSAEAVGEPVEVVTVNWYVPACAGDVYVARFLSGAGAPRLAPRALGGRGTGLAHRARCEPP